MPLTAKDLVKTDGVLIAGADDNLGSALAKIQSSHDAVFVRDGDKLLGVISPYHVLYRTAYPHATKVKNCLFSPPKLRPETAAAKIARLMLDSKIYFLPVLTDTGRWLGVVSFRRLLRRQPPEKLDRNRQPLVTVKDTVSLGQARNIMKEANVSRLVVTGDSGRLAGILTRYDLGEALVQPKRSPHRQDRGGEKIRASRQPIRTLIKRDVVTVDVKASVHQMVELILDKRIGSLVMINRDRKPVGIVTIRDLLASVATVSDGKPVPSVSVKLPPDFPDTKKFMHLVRRFWKKQLNRRPLLKFNLKFNVHRNAANAVSGYKVLLAAKPEHRAEVIAKGSGRDWKATLKKGLNRLVKKLSRN